MLPVFPVSLTGALPPLCVVREIVVPVHGKKQKKGGKKKERKRITRVTAQSLVQDGLHA